MRNEQDRANEGAWWALLIGLVWTIFIMRGCM